MSKRYENRYGRGGQWRDRDRADDRGSDRNDDRGYVERAGDQVRSWFGDDEAERRRRMDEQRDRQHEGRSDWNRSDWHRPDRDRDDHDRYNQNRSDWNSSSWNRPEARGDWNRSNDWRSSSRDESRYRDPASTYSSGEMNQGADWDAYRYRQNSSTPDRDRGWNREHHFDRDRPQRDPSGGWSADDGRAEFGAPPTGDYGFGQRSMGPLGGQQQVNRWGRGPKGYQRADNRIHEDVCDRLTYSDVDAENIEVAVQNGEVTLSGTVRDRSDKRRAEDVVEEISGVRDVHNNIRVQREERGSSGDRGIGMSDHTNTQQPGSVLGVNPAAAATLPTNTTNTKK